MAIVKMKFISTRSDREHLEDMLLKALNNELLVPELAANIVNDANEGVVFTGDNPFANFLSDLANLANSIGLNPAGKKLSDKAYSVKEIEEFIEEFSAKVNLSLSDEDISLTDDDRKALKALSAYDFEKLHKTRYVHFGFGRISIDSYRKLHLTSRMKFDTAILHSNRNYYWICYVCSKDTVSEILKLLDSLYFEEINIPNIDVHKVIEDYKERLRDIYAYCNLNNKIRSLYEYVAVLDDKYILSGFVAEDKVEDFKACFKGLDVDFRIKDPSQRKDLKPPTLLRNNWFFKPFELFVKMHSLPNYYDFDPTIILGITYSLLFGIMFGDLGQGLILFLAGIYLQHKKKNELFGIISRIGITSMFFGFLYGSVFGNEEILGPIHESLFNIRGKLIHVMDPDFTSTLLMATLYIGMALIIMSMILNIYRNFKRKQFAEILFGVNGLPGISLYICAIFAMFLMLSASLNSLSLIILLTIIIIAVLVIFFKDPLIHLYSGKDLKPKEGWGNYILVSFFEVFEVLLSFLSNTISFLRVGGFVLSHAGMMLVVVTLSEMFGGASGILVLILGNIFVIALEGLVVGIQTLRLEYYEMFSRYYEGGGKKFEYLHL